MRNPAPRYSNACEPEAISGLPLTREKIIAGKKTQMIMRISG